MSVTVSVEQAVKDMRKEFRDLTNQEFNLGVARAINHTLSKAKTASSKEIRAVYAIAAKDIGAALSIKRASGIALYGFLIAQGKPIPLKKFKPTRTGKGISVEIKKGSRQIVNSAFMATVGSGHVGVFARGQYNGGTFAFRKKRVRPGGKHITVNGKSRPSMNDLSINELTTVSVPIAFSQQAILRTLASKMEQDFTPRMMHELSRFR